MQSVIKMRNLPLALVVFSALLLTAVLSSPDDVISLCTTHKGFAGEVNSEFSVKIASPPRAGEAIVFVLRPIPFTAISGVVPWIAASMNVSYRILGLETYAISDRSGVVSIVEPEIGVDATVNVKISNLRLDGATPFLFYSYHSGFYQCGLEISPRASFTGPLPTHNFNSDVVSTLYLKAQPPAGATGFILHGTGVMTISASQVTPDAQRGTDPAVVSRDTLVPLRPGAATVRFDVRPEGAVETQMIHISIQWDMTHGSPSPPAVNGGGAGSSTYAPRREEESAPATPANTEAATSAKKAVTESTSIVSVVIVLTLVYFTSRSIYNYRVQKITTFPEFVPHHELFSQCAAFCGTFASHVRNKGRQSYLSRGAGGYSDVNRDEVYATS